MVGLLATIKGADFSAAAIGFAAPVQSNLEFWNYFGDTAAKTARNLVPGKAQPSVTGTPVYGAGFATLTGLNNFLDSGVTDQAEVTLLVASRNPSQAATSYGVLISSSTASLPRTALEYYSNPTAANAQPSVQSCRSNAGTNALVYGQLAAQPSLNTWGFYVGRSGAAYARIDDKTRGLSASGAITYPPQTANGLNYRIGSFQTTTPGSNNQGLVDMAFAAIYSRCLTDAEITSIYQRVQTYLATRAITV